MGHLFYLLHRWYFAISENPPRIPLWKSTVFSFLYSLTVFVFCKGFPHCCIILFGEPVLLRENALFWLLQFHTGVPLQATALSNLHFLNQIFPCWIPSSRISSRDHPLGSSASIGAVFGAVLAGCSCMELNLLQVQVPAPREEGLCSRLGPSCLARCVGTQLRPLESRKATGAWLCPWDRRCGEQRQPQSSALPAWGHSIPAERGQHEAPPSIQPCAKSETRDAIFPPLHSFLWFFTRHLLALTQSGVQI